MRLKLFALSVVIATSASPVFAQDNTCEAKGTNGMVTLVLCPPGLDQEAWKAAGEAACGTRKPCGAWIWDEVSNVPLITPDSHDKLPKNAVRSAKAIWVNEQESLMVLDKQSN